MRVIAISGDGAGAGKTYAAKAFTTSNGQAVWTMADGIRAELKHEYPTYDWFNRSQTYKNGVVVPEYRPGATVRTVLLEWGQTRCVGDPCYWVRDMVDRLKDHGKLLGTHTIAVDDVRKICELDYLRASFRDVLHLHVENPDAIYEPEFEAEDLKKRADYVIRWK